MMDNYDKLVERLRDARYITTTGWILKEVREAAKAITQLQAQNKEMEEEITRLNAALKYIGNPENGSADLAAYARDSIGDEPSADGE